MVGLILLIVYLIGIPVSFFLIGGQSDFDGSDDKSSQDTHDRLLSISISICAAMCWPIFWAFCFVVYLLAILIKGF